MTGALEIERNNREKVMRIYKEAEVRVAAGEAFALGPREHAGPVSARSVTLNPVRFSFPLIPTCLIVPLLLVGCEQVVKTFHLDQLGMLAKRRDL